MYPTQISKNTIIIVIDGIPHTVSTLTDPDQYAAVKEAVKSERWEDVKTLVVSPVKKAVQEYTAKGLHRDVEIIGGEIFYKGYPVRNAVADKILELHEEGFDLTPMTNFLDRVEHNQDIRARNELWNFVEANGFTINTKGFIVAYRAVRDDFKDLHTGTYDNSPGQTVEMDRKEVCADKDRTCAPGLHFATYDYAQNKYGGWHGDRHRLVLVEIDPADVVSIPVDYNNAKGRCCRYTVLQEIEDKQQPTTRTFHSPDIEEDEEPYCDWCGGSDHWEDDCDEGYDPWYDDEDDGYDSWWDTSEEEEEEEEDDTRPQIGEDELARLRRVIREQHGKLSEAPDSLKKDLLTEALNTTGWVIEGAQGAATMLDVAGSTFRGWMRQLGIERP